MHSFYISKSGGDTAVTAEGPDTIIPAASPSLSPCTPPMILTEHPLLFQMLEAPLQLGRGQP